MGEFPEGRDKLYWLMERLLTGYGDVAAFCKAFEPAYNFEVRKSDLSPTERQAFDKLFESVSWYSPFPNERSATPQYKSEKQIEDAVRETSKMLGVS